MEEGKLKSFLQTTFFFFCVVKYIYLHTKNRSLMGLRKASWHTETNLFFINFTAKGQNYIY